MVKKIASRRRLLKNETRRTAAAWRWPARRLGVVVEACSKREGMFEKCGEKAALSGHRGDQWYWRPEVNERPSLSAFFYEGMLLSLDSSARSINPGRNAHRRVARAKGLVMTRKR